MRLISLTCPECGTVIAANVLERNRVMNCPGLNCENVVEFDDLDDDDKRYISNNPDEYRMNE